MDKVRLSDLFKIFLRIGGFTFGGGYAMLPLIEKELVEEREWLSSKEFIDMIAIVQGIPGIIAVNSSLFIGYKLRGIVGALTAVAGIALPSVIIIISIANLLLRLQKNLIVNSLFTGIRASVVVLIFWAGYRMSKKAIVDYKSIFFTVGMVVGILVLKIHPIVLIALAGVMGILIAKIKTGESDNDTN